MIRDSKFGLISGQPAKQVLLVRSYVVPVSVVFHHLPDYCCCIPALTAALVNPRSKSLANLATYPTGLVDQRGDFDLETCLHHPGCIQSFWDEERDRQGVKLDE